MRSIENIEMCEGEEWCVDGEVLTMRLEPGTLSSPEESLAFRLCTPEVAVFGFFISTPTH